MMIKKHIMMVMLGLGLALPFFSQAQSDGKFEKGLYAAKKDTLPYQILMPRNFDPQKKYPVIVVLHGSGERGNDNQAQMKYGTGLFLSEASRDKFPAIVIYPQCPANDYWANVKITTDSAQRRRVFNFVEGGEPTKAMKALMGLIDNFLEKPYVNKHQVYMEAFLWEAWVRSKFCVASLKYLPQPLPFAVAITQTMQTSMPKRCRYGYSMVLKMIPYRRIILR
jgi:hypothetical protein